jgi:hypothetical protein
MQVLVWANENILSLLENAFMDTVINIQQQ